MARDEIREITMDKWDEEIWGALTHDRSDEQLPHTKLFFYFGAEDHWVTIEAADCLARRLIVD